MDETTTGLLTQSSHETLSKYQKDDGSSNAQQKLISTQLSTLFKTQIPIEKSADITNTTTTTTTRNNNGLNCCSGASTPKRSISISNPLNEFLKPHSSILSQNNSSESDDDGEHSKHDEINLYPLTNQVGGHTRLLLLNATTVIKPLNIRELEFYQNIPGNDIQEFVPSYKGKLTGSSPQ